MALQELSPPPPILGYAQLGNAIAQGANDYRVRSQQIQDQDRLRAQQLADAARTRDQQLSDIQSARAYESSEGDKRRQEALDDREKLLKVENREAGIQILINEGYLNPNDRDDPAKLNDARARFQADGLDKQYVELFNTPDENGHALLLHREATNPALVQAAKDKLSAIKAKQAQFQMGQPANAQATVDDLRSQLNQHQQNIAQINAKLNQPARNYSLNDPEVQQLAVQLAEQAKPGSGRNRQAVAQQLSVAQKQLNDLSYLQHSQDVQAATRQLDGERYAEANVTQALDHAIQTSKVFPSAAPSAPPPPGALTLGGGPSQLVPLAPGDFQNAAHAIIGAPAGPQSGPPPPLSFDQSTQDPNLAPIYSAANQKLASDATTNAAAIKKSTILDPLSALNAKIQGADQLLSNYRSLLTSNETQYDPVKLAKDAQSIAAQRTEWQRQAADLQAQLQGPVPASVTPPSINTGTSYTPTAQFNSSIPPISQKWWQAPPSQ